MLECGRKLLARKKAFNWISVRTYSSQDLLILRPRISIIGVGGAGSNTVDNMIARTLDGVKFCVGNTDAQALSRSRCDESNRVQLGKVSTRGLGAGALPMVGKQATEEVIAEVLKVIEPADMLFLTAGMGGGTGTGGAPVIAKAAREKGILTVGIVTKPFHFEGKRRMKLAEEGIQELKKNVDTLIIVPNQKILHVGDQKQTFDQAFEMVNDVLYDGVKAVTDVIVKPGLINLDFADVRTITSGPGWGLMGTGRASGKNRALMAAEAALNNPLLGDLQHKGATGVLISVAGGSDLGLLEVDEIVQMVHDAVSPDANIIFGATSDSALEGNILVSLILTGPWSEEPSILKEESSANENTKKKVDAKSQKASPEKPVAKPTHDQKQEPKKEGDDKENQPNTSGGKKFWDSWF